ncbi:hypothetical protein R6Q57_006087 [Mikania cordata]
MSVDDIMSSMAAFPSLRSLSMAWSRDMGGKLFANEVPNLPYLEVLFLSGNNLNGTLPMEGEFGVARFILVQLVLQSQKASVFRFESVGEKIEVETEEPIGWIPMFQLKYLVLSNCIKKRPNGSVVPSFLLHQHKLRVLDLSHNSLEGQVPNWLFKNNKNMGILTLKDNSFRGVIHMRYKSNLIWLDMSGNHITGTIPDNLQSFIPRIEYLNFSSNELNGVIPTSMLDLTRLWILDLSNNRFSGEVPKGLFTNLSSMKILKLSNNTLYGDVLSGNLSLGRLNILQLDNNCFTGNIGTNTSGNSMLLSFLDISENHFTGRIPSWMSNMCSNSDYSDGCELVARNNRLDGPFPFGEASFEFLDISQNSFSGPIPSGINLKYTEHLHLGSNRFTGLVPDAFQNLTNVLTLDISQNYFSGRIPEFFGELSNLRILLLGKNNFIGSIPEKLCQLNNVSLIDISSNFLTGLIPRCLNNITGPKQLAFIQKNFVAYSFDPLWNDLVLQYYIYNMVTTTDSHQFETRDEIQFTTKRNHLSYKGNILDYMSGLDLSSNKLTGEIPEELGMLTHILALNLSHNKLSGPIPVSFSNLSQIESLDLSSNSLSGKVPSELIKLTKLEVFDVSYNNLSGRLPEQKAQFNTFGKESYEGNLLLCGTPLENNCTTTPQVSEPSTKKDPKKWYDIDKESFYGSSCSAWFVFMLGFVVILYINPYWRRTWLDFVEECMYTCYYFLYDFVRLSLYCMCCLSDTNFDLVMFVSLVYADDVYQRQNPKKKKVPSICFNTNESLNELDAKLIDDQHNIKEKSADSKGKAKVDKVKLPLTLVNKKRKKRKYDQEDLLVTKNKKKTRNENEELQSSFLMKKKKTQRIKGKKNDVVKKEKKTTTSKPKNAEEWVVTIKEKTKELDKFVKDVELLIVKCFDEIEDDDQIPPPIEEWMSRLTKYKEMRKNEEKDENDGAVNTSLIDDNVEVQGDQVKTDDHVSVEKEMEEDQEEGEHIEDVVHMQGYQAENDDDVEKEMEKAKEEEHNDDVVEMKDKVEDDDDVKLQKQMEEDQKQEDKNEEVVEVQGHKDKNEEDRKEEIVQVQELNELNSSLVDEMIEAVDKVEADLEVKVDEDDDKIGDLIANLEFLSSNEADCQETNKKSNEEKETDDEILFIRAEKPKNQVERQKRIIKLSDALRSPYRQRIVQLNVERVKIEERISEWIFSATGEVWEILFDTAINNKFAKISFESFYPKQYIHIGLMSCWSNVLNYEEQFKSKDSTSRLFFPCNMLGENNFRARMRLNELLMNLETNIELTLLSSIYKSIEDVDILIVPILQDSHYYLICFNFKNETIDVIDNMKEKMKPKQKYRLSRMTQAMLNYLENHFPSLHNKLDGVVPTKLDLPWQTDKNFVDCGVLAMRHMETYKGQPINEWANDCGLKKEADQYVIGQLNDLRIKYLSKML